MDSLITVFNAIHEINKELKLDTLQLPQIVVIGAQSSGKSSVLESIVGYDFVPKGVGTVTRCPMRLQLINTPSKSSGSQDDFVARFSHKQETYSTFTNIAKEIELETERRCVAADQFISDEEIVLEVRGPQFPTLTFVDLPGFVKVAQPDQPTDLEERVEALCRKYISTDNSIILAISPSNCDIATSEAVKVSRVYDPRGSRTFHVLTKLDIMDEGTSAHAVLTDSGQMRSLGVVGVVNRSQQGVKSRLPIDQQRQKEREYLAERYPDIYHTQGTQYLVDTLVSILRASLQRYIPKFKEELTQRITNLTKKLRELDPPDKLAVLSSGVSDFCSLYSRTLNGQLDSYSDRQLEGGSMISHELYIKFPESIENLQTRELDEVTLEKAIKNTGGTKDANYSFQLPFQLLIRKDIRQCEIFAFQSLDSVRCFLLEFIDSVLKLIDEINNYPLVANRLREICRQIVMQRFNKVQSLVKDYVECEWYDITLKNPYEDLLQDLRNMPIIPSSQADIDSKVIQLSNIRDMILKLGLHHPINLYYPFIYMGLIVLGLSSKFMEAFHSSKRQPMKFVITVIENNIGLEARKVDVFNHIGDDIKDFAEGFQKTLKATVTQEDKKAVGSNQVVVIRHLLDRYFVMVRRNVTNFVPKVVQTFLVREIGEEMRRVTERKLLYDGNFEQLLSDPEKIAQIRHTKNDLEKLKEMQIKFENKYSW